MTTWVSDLPPDVAQMVRPMEQPDMEARDPRPAHSGFTWERDQMWSLESTEARVISGDWAYEASLVWVGSPCPWVGS